MEDEELREKIEQLRQNRSQRDIGGNGERPEGQRDFRQAYRREKPVSVREVYEEDFYEEGGARKKEEGFLGVFTFQGILAVAIAILYVLAMTLSPELSHAALSEVRNRSINDFSFRDQVYETVGTLLTYLNETQPVAGGALSSDQETPSGGESPHAVQPPVENGGLAVSDTASGSPSLNGKGGEFTPLEGRALPSNATYAPLVFTGRITFPIEGGFPVSSGFGFREHPISGENEFHTAVDIAAPKGTDVLAAADGEVILSEESGSLGKHIVVDHGNGFQTVYGHCDRLLARTGIHVREGEVIAKVGNTGDSTGSHLHFGMKKDGLYFDPACVFPKAVEATDDD